MEGGLDAGAKSVVGAIVGSDDMVELAGGVGSALVAPNMVVVSKGNAGSKAGVLSDAAEVPDRGEVDVSTVRLVTMTSTSAGFRRDQLRAKKASPSSITHPMETAI